LLPAVASAENKVRPQDFNYNLFEAKKNSIVSTHEDTHFNRKNTFDSDDLPTSYLASANNNRVSIFSKYDFSEKTSRQRPTIFSDHSSKREEGSFHSQ
jgi:hypothetical protein